MRLKPVAACADLDLDGDVKPYGALHLFDDERLHCLQFGHGHFEYQLVVDLQEHLCGEPLTAYAFPDVDHRQLDEVGAAPLDWGVDGHTLRRDANPRVVAEELWQIAPSP